MVGRRDWERACVVGRRMAAAVLTAAETQADILVVRRRASNGAHRRVVLGNGGQTAWRLLLR